MHYTRLPGTELTPAAISLGSTHVGSRIDRDTSFRLFDVYLEAGGNFIDTANVYGDWLPGERSISEKTVGAWLRSRKARDKVILATKGAHPELETMHIPRMSRAEIVQDLNESLESLQTDVVDLYWLHRDDPQRPVGDILETLNEQVKAGKIRYFGCSNWRTERIRTARAYASEHGLHGFVANQTMWSLAAVDLAGIKDKTMVAMDEEMVRYHRQAGLPAVAYSSQANGLFHKMAQGTWDRMDPGVRGMYQVEANRRRLERIQRLAADTGLSVTQIVLGYLQSQPFVTIPIVGSRTVEQLFDSLQAAGVTLTPDQVRYLEEGRSKA
jgi:aryl-alcohol dehydrogenase-like predicted oxidoreductase